MGIVCLEQKLEYFTTEWQEEDLAELLDENRQYLSGANWSEMGCYKTTTGLWYAERYAKKNNIENPRVLIITTKSGKGTYRDAIPKALPPTWKTYNLSTKQVSVIHPFGLEEDYDIDFYFQDLKNPTRPTITLAHYHCFVNKAPIWQMLKLIEWDVIICDEAHRMKNRTTQWTRNIKVLSK